jgi:imidazolonepropionase-like amidohydrolase
MAADATAMNQKVFLIAAAASATLLATPGPAVAQTEKLTVIRSGRTIGHLTATTQGTRVVIDYDYKNNGRGPTLAEVLTLSAKGLPSAWTITGTTTFGNKIDESFGTIGARAEWRDSTGPGSMASDGEAVYVPQTASPWSLGLYARLLNKTVTKRLPALPAGTLTLKKGADLTVTGAPGAIRVTAYALGGASLTPDYVLLDARGHLFAVISPAFIVVRGGYEKEDARLRTLAAAMSSDRLVAIQKASAHRYGAPVRIRNVRLFDPRAKALTGPVSVVVSGNVIAGVEPPDSPGTPGEVRVDGGNGTLVPGMFEMHAHLDQEDALLNLLSGTTSVRDMGNTNEVLDGLIARIDAGSIGGPRVTRSGFIEGRSPFNSNNGIVVDSEAAALEAVRWYGARGYWQIKIYNSINPAWVPAMVQEAHRLGMRVAGHVPAFTNADAVIAAGYDELTHINQFMLGWVLQPDEDTRTLLRLTAMRRFPMLDLTSPAVRRTIDAMARRKLAIDPTLAIHEELTLNRNGVVPPGAADYLDHMPVGYQRSSKAARTDASAPGDDEAYRGAFERILATVKALRDGGVTLIPGTDLGGSFTYHRELELYQRIGMTPADILAWATLDMARYLGQDQRLGSIEKGKLADFFLIPGDPTRDFKAIKTIRMVVKDGAVYFPSEIYPEFGIRPFADKPPVTR